MAARKSMFLRWIEEAEARRLCEWAALERLPAGACRLDLERKPAPSATFGLRLLEFRAAAHATADSRRPAGLS